MTETKTRNVTTVTEDHDLTPQSRAQRVVEWVMEETCEAIRHAGGCALLNDRPFRRLWKWALGM